MCHCEFNWSCRYNSPHYAKVLLTIYCIICVIDVKIYDVGIIIDAVLKYIEDIDYKGRYDILMISLITFSI